MLKKLERPNELIDITQFEFGKRYNSEFNESDEGFLFLDKETESSDDIVIRLIDNRAYWDVADSYIENAPLYGRPFIHGLFDCYTFFRDLYKREFDIDIIDAEYEDAWWNNGKNHYVENVNAAGFSLIEPPLQKGDLVAMRVMSPVINHVAVYMGDGQVAHHLGGCDSVLEKFRPAYLAMESGFYRHESM